MEIKLKESKKKKKEKLPLYVTALFIALSGVSLLVFTVYYIAFLPVPHEMQPLRVRILTTLRLENILEENLADYVVIVEYDDSQEVSVLSEPEAGADTSFTALTGEFHEEIERSNGWVKIRGRFGDRVEQGWLPEEAVEKIED